MTSKRIRAATLIAAAVAVAVLAFATAALAHTEATLDNPQAGATNVTLTLTAEAESKAAGITKVEVVLPDGIAVTEISLTRAPTGWTFNATKLGFAVAGEALPVGADAKTAVRIAQLPLTATVLVFKTLVSYSDGHIDRWIEEPTPGAPEPDNPAPTVSLKPAAGAASTTTAASPIATAVPSPTRSAPAAASATESTSSSSLGGWIVAAVVALAVLVGVALLLRHRRRTTTRSASSGP